MQTQYPPTLSHEIEIECHGPFGSNRFQIPSRVDLRLDIEPSQLGDWLGGLPEHLRSADDALQVFASLIDEVWECDGYLGGPISRHHLDVIQRLLETSPAKRVGDTDHLDPRWEKFSWIIENALVQPEGTEFRASANAAGVSRYRDS